LVGFGPKSRYLGEAAKTQEISNLKNTVSSLTRLAGRSFKDPEVQIEREYISAPLVDINGQVGVEVNYLGKKERFTGTQLMAMFLTKVKQTASADLKLPVSDIVISCPAWYTDAQRRSMLDASEIAGLKLLRLINDNTAVALGYGITKTDLPGTDEKPRRVAFVDIGHSNYTCSIGEFVKGQLSIKATACDRQFGGRNFDKALVDHFAKEFKEKFKIDINENPKARVRVQAACEKLKKILSANSNGPISIESLMNDVDVRGVIKREEFEDLIRPLLDRATEPLQKALADAKLKPEDIDAVEMVGGCTRVPSLKTAIQQFFGKNLSFTLNQDEAVARGCAFSCAILSPAFRVRDFSVHDIISYPIEFTWEQDPDIPDEDTSLAVFNKGNVMPSTKILTFYRKKAFDIEARYFKPELLPGKISPWIGRFSVKGVKADANNDFMICKLKARVNQHGILNVEQGYYVEEQEVEEPVPEPKDADKKDTDVRELANDSYSASVPKVDGGGGNGDDRPRKISKLGESNFVVPPPVTSTSSSHSIVLDNSTLTNASQAMDTGEAAEKPKVRKIRKQVRKGELPLSAGTASLDQASKDALAEKELQMMSEDKLVADTEDKKNELESFIYDLRGKIDDQYAEFANEDEKTRVREKCTETEVSFPELLNRYYCTLDTNCFSSL
jgi:heat shock protein 4